MQEAIKFADHILPINLRPVKTKMVNALGHAVRFLSGNTLRSLDGQVFDVSSQTHPRDYLNIVLGHYERDEINVLRRWFKPDSTIIEIGSNIGVVARYAFLEKLHHGGMYVCVEPNPYSHEALIANMQRGQQVHPRKAYQVIAAAICEYDLDGQDLEFFPRKNLGSCLAHPDNRKANDITIQVPSFSFGALMNRYAPAGASVICDAEGAEISMLNEPNAFKNVRQIAIELHGPEITGQSKTKDELAEGFQKLGFTLKDRIRSVYYFSRDPS